MVFTKNFERIAPILVGDLVKSLDLTPEQAAGIVGNLAAESGLQAIQEKNPISGRGGFGYAQWTGPRRVAFEKWCKEQGLKPDTYAANYGFLVEELKTTQKNSLEQVKKTKTAKAAAETFGYHFEKFKGYENIEGNPNYATRVKFAERALELCKQIKPIEDVSVATLQRDLAALSKTVADLAVHVAKLEEKL